MIYVYAVALTLLNLLFWAGILFGLPGAWLMVLIASLLTWWLPGDALFSWTTLTLATGLAALGEVLEFGFGAAGARKAGGSRRGAALAIVGGLIGAILGTPLAPIAGTLIGACLGAFAGSVVGDLWAGRPLVHSMEAGQGAAVGRLWGTAAKLTVGGVIVVLLAIDAVA